MIKKETKKYVGAGSGITIRHLNVDSYTADIIVELQQMFEEHGKKFSQNAIIRAACREYSRFLKYNCEDWYMQILLVERAAKGVL